MKKYIAVAVIIGCIAISLVDCQPYAMNNIQTFLKSQVDRHQTPSVQYVFFDSESTIFEARHGLKNVRLGESVDHSTTYHLFSITKTFTALAILQLAQEGKLRLDETAITYIPDFPFDRSITVRQLLNHTSGITNPIPLRWIHLADEHSTFQHDEFFADLLPKHIEPEFAPGTGFKYSNLGYVVLGQIIEKVSHESFEQFVTTNIIHKSGISHSDISFTIDSARHATGYHKWWSLTNAALGFMIDKHKFMNDREGRWKPFNTFYNNGKAYGGIVGSADGLVKYAQTLLVDNSPLIDNRHKDVLFSESLVNGKPTGMSYSWFTGTLKGHRYYAHAGGGGGYYVELRVYPDIKVGSVIMYNRSGMTDERILDKADSFFITQP